ncbi:hypothetical protein P3T76_011234 [Phytophthora citrophthora]|uniref:Uncharacterized protein n=1 Tax=Phytophthora citrophthora TaxID=4793 RepID=A0AAD9LFF9_9STRA|nr:hypothetical protein P3T76_011234 [Phytophthora citrophthora]
MDKSLFDTIVKKVSNADTSLVGPSIQYFSQYLSEIGKEKRDELVPIVVKRVKWLGGQIEALDKTFTWEMPDARLPVPSEKKTKKETDETEVVDKSQTFLRGGETSMTTKGVKKFKELQDAQNFTAKYLRVQDQCSFEMEVSAADGEVLVTITKTRDWFLTQQNNVVLYQAELRLLKEKFRDDLDADNGDKKRTRLNE